MYICTYIYVEAALGLAEAACELAALGAAQGFFGRDEGGGITAAMRE
jgi:hypothetical protein